MSAPEGSRAVRRPAALVARLRDPQCYPHAVGGVELLETHIS